MTIQYTPIDLLNKISNNNYSYTAHRIKKVYSRQIKSAVSIAPAAAAKRHISLCGCVHNFILAVSLFDRQYNKYRHKHRKTAG